MIRLDRLLSAAAEISRSQAGKAVRAGRVALADGTVLRDPEQKLDEKTATVLLDGMPCRYAVYRYFLLDKPTGILTACRDGKQPVVLDLLPETVRRRDLAPVGRLDKDTSGLLLLTDDGDFAHRVLAPRSGVEKLYEAVTDGTVTEEDVRLFREGLVLADGTRCLPAVLEPLGENRARVTVREGKYHQVRRMLAAVGKPVLGLRRLRVGGLTLPDGSVPGSWRELEPAEANRVFDVL